LGVFPDWEYKDSSVDLQTGDLLLLFTDGITEAMASDGREFGEERLIGTATSLSVEPLGDLRRGIVEPVKRFCNSHLSDDATLLLIAALRGKPKQRNLAQNEAIASEQYTLPDCRHPIETNSEPAPTSRQYRSRFCDFNHNRVWRRSWLESSLDLKLNSCLQRIPP
jgi:hypothetical protein